jgi:hypothetical protein
VDFVLEGVRYNSSVSKNRDVVWATVLISMAGVSARLLLSPAPYPPIWRSFFSFFPSLIRVCCGSERQATALADANAVLEYLTSQARPVFAGERKYRIPLPAAPLSSDMPIVIAPLSLGHTDQTGLLTISEVADQHGGAVCVAVTVQWIDKNGVDRQVAVNGSFSPVSPSPSASPSRRHPSE